MLTEKYRIPKNCNFDDLNNRSHLGRYSYSFNSCSPEIFSPTFEGILINAPDKIVLQDTLTIKLACSFSFSIKRIVGFKLFEEVENSILFTVMDMGTQKSYSGKVPDLDLDKPFDTNPIPNPHPEPAPKKEALPDLIHRGYVNLNLAEVVRLPIKPGQYIAFATLATFKSNVLQFVIIR